MIARLLAHWVMAGPDRAECVEILDDVHLCKLAGWLAQDFDENGATGEMLGLCLVEQARRFSVLIEVRGAGRPGNGLAQDAPATNREQKAGGDL